MKRQVPLQNILSVPSAGIGGNYSIKCPLGDTYHKITIDLGDATSGAAIDNIEVKVNGNQIMQYEDFADLQDEGETFYRDEAGNVRYLNIYFDRLNVTPVAQNNITAIFTGERVYQVGSDGKVLADTGPQVTSLDVTVSFAASLATTPSILAWATVSNMQTVPLIKRRVIAQASLNSVTGWIQARPFLMNRDNIQSIVIKHADTDLTQVQLFQNQVKTFDRTATVNAQIQNVNDYVEPNTASRYVLTPDDLGEANELISQLSIDGNRLPDMYLNLNMATAQANANIAINYLSDINSGIIGGI